MPATLHVLIEGFVREDGDAQRVHPTICLIESAGRRIITDPGILATQRLMTDALESHGMTTTDVTDVFLTHHHVDHTRNIGMFPDAVVVDGDSLYDDDAWRTHDGDGYEIAPGVAVMITPGHSAEGASLRVVTDAGVHVVTHAWWFADRTPETDPMAWDQSALEDSRARILREADVVVPGHGPAFRA